MDNERKYISLIVSLFVSFTLCVFAPLEMYITNVGELWFDIYEILPFTVIAGVLLFLALFAIQKVLSRFSDKAGSVAGLVFMTVGLCFYIQGNFMSNDFGNFDGEEIPWESFYYQGVLEAIAWIGIIALIAALYVKYKDGKFFYVAEIVLICIVLVQAVTLVTVAVMDHGLISKVDYVSTNINESENSKNRNFNILVLDTFDSRVFATLCEENPEYVETFEDFTFYSNCVGRFTLTDFAIPQILTGEDYLNQCTYGEFIEEAYEQSPLLNKLCEEGYCNNLYTTVTIPQGKAIEKFDNTKKIKFGATSPKVMSLFYRLVAFRYMPQCVKPLFIFDMDDFEDYKEIRKIVDADNSSSDGNRTDDAIEEYKWGNDVFYGMIPQMTREMEESCFHFYHIKGIHAKRNLTESMEEITEEEEMLSPEEEGKVVLAIVDAYLEKLREIDAYDNSVIVIMADHGSNLYSGKIHAPLLLVKGMNEKHTMDVSKKPVSYVDLQEAFAKLLDGECGEPIFDIADGERERVFYYTTFDGQLRSYSKNEPFEEYVITGDSNDVVTISKTGREY